jgi:hypothetical protein
MHLKNVPLKKYQCLSESVEAVRAFMIGSGNPASAVFVLLRERRNVTGLMYQAHVGMVESYVFDSRNISAYIFFSGAGVMMWCISVAEWKGSFSSNNNNNSRSNRSN